MIEFRGEAPLSRPNEDVWIPSVCRICSNCCGIKVHRKNGIVVKIEGLPDNPHNNGRMCGKGMAAIMSMYDPARPKTPLIRTNPDKGLPIDPGWREATWDQAMELVVSKLKKVIAEDPRKVVILRGVGEPDWVGSCVAAFAKTIGTPNFAGGPFFATHVDACYLINGTMHVEIDVPRCRYLLLFGSQRGGVVNHDAMRAAKDIADALGRGMKLVVIDPICSPMASKADEWIPIRPGTDGALALSMLHVLLNELAIFDREFLRTQTNAAYLVNAGGRYARDEQTGKPLIWDENSKQPRAFDEPSSPALEGKFEIGGRSCEPAFSRLKEHLKRYVPEDVTRITTVPAERIRRLAREFGEAASIGSTTMIEGRSLPFRPVAAFCDSRGLSSHQFGMWASMNVHMLNIVLGALDVPGGSLSTNILGPGERLRVEESEEGLVVGPGDVRSYPPRRPELPQTVNFRELLPTGRAMGTIMMGLSLVQHPQLLPYQPEILILNNFNMMMSGVDPAMLAQALKKFRFIVFLGDKLSETAEFADVVLPLRQHAQRLDFPMNSMRGWVNGDQWYYTLRQPVLEDETAAKHPVEVYMEFARRLGHMDEFVAAFSSGLGLKEPYRLETGRSYSVEEIIDREIKSTLGSEYGIERLRKSGFVAFPRTLAERFPRAVKKLPRTHLYFEFLIETGQQLDRVAAEAGLALDTRGFQALPCWYPCAAQEHAPQEYDLIAVNYKLPFHSYNMTQDNPWLAELAERHPYAYNVLINTKTAAKNAIEDGDSIWLETARGVRVRGIAKVSQCIHPEVIGIASCFGQWGRARSVGRHRGIHFNSLLPYGVSQIDTMAGLMDACVKVRIEKERPEALAGRGAQRFGLGS
ncbi:MAG: molybdopterin-dependent oxidoreductase [Deltaproteobacteria bacterium]|nr:molybdopterin-dependent oxidoreductase [Deltaproteobacteria bacterium]